jgi:hypothetical protein
VSFKIDMELSRIANQRARVARITSLQSLLFCNPSNPALASLCNVSDVICGVEAKIDHAVRPSANKSQPDLFSVDCGSLAAARPNQRRGCPENCRGTD